MKTATRSTRKPRSLNRASGASKVREEAAAKPRAKTPAKAAAKTKNVGGEFTVTMKCVKETPGAFQFAELDGRGRVLEIGDSMIGRLYVRKNALDGESPKTIEVTVQF